LALKIAPVFGRQVEEMFQLEDEDRRAGRVQARCRNRCLQRASVSCVVRRMRVLCDETGGGRLELRASPLLR
jgi:hypothetical protein